MRSPSPLFVIALGCLAPAAAAAGCSRSEASDPSVVTIRLLSAPDIGHAMAEIVARFERGHSKIRVELVQGPASTDARQNMYTTAFMAGQSPYDVVHMDVVWVPMFAAQGWLRALDDLWSPAARRAFIPSGLEGSRYAGKLYRVPSQSDAGMLYFRKDLLDAAGLQPPRTFAELSAQAQALQDPPARYGFVFEGKQYEGLVCTFLELAWGSGAQLLDASGHVAIDSPQAIAALRWLVGAVQVQHIAPPGVLAFQEEEARHTFQQGHAVFMRNWPYAFNLAQAPDSPVRGKVGIEPMVHGPGGTSAATLGGWGFGIAASSPHPRQAWQFIDFATGAESQKLAFLRAGIIPTRQALFSDPELIARAPYLPRLLPILERARPRPVHPAYARLSDTLQVHLSAALSQQETPEQALHAAAAEMRAFLVSR